MSYPYYFNRNQPSPMGQFPNYYQVPVQPMQERQQLLIEDAIQIARQRVPGLVVQAELESKYGRQIFEVDIITAEGVKYEVEVDANSGEVIEISLD